MRYYTITYTNQLDENGQMKQGEESFIATNIKSLKDLPPGTTICKCITDRDGTLIDVQGVEIVNGKPQIKGKSIRRTRMSYQL